MFPVSGCTAPFNGTSLTVGAGYSLVLGLSMAMDKQAAFQVLCQNGKVTSWLLVTETDGRYYGRRQVACSDWEYFGQANFWDIQTGAAGCVDGTAQHVVINFVSGKLARTDVWCEGTEAHLDTLWDAKR